MQHLHTERKILTATYFASPEGRGDLYQYCTTEKSVVDMSFGFTITTSLHCSMALSFGLTGWRIGSGTELLIANLLCASHVRETVQ